MLFFAALGIDSFSSSSRITTSSLAGAKLPHYRTIKDNPSVWKKKRNRSVKCKGEGNGDVF